MMLFLGRGRPRAETDRAYHLSKVISRLGISCGRRGAKALVCVPIGLQFVQMLESEAALETWREE